MAYQDVYDQVRNSFVNRQDAIQQNAFTQQQRAAQRQAGNAIADGDNAGGANALFRAGDLAGGEGVQKYDDGQRQQHAVAAQRVTRGIRAAVQAGHSPSEAYDMAIQAAPALGINPTDLQKIRPAFDRDPKGFLDAVDAASQKVKEDYTMGGVRYSGTTNQPIAGVMEVSPGKTIYGVGAAPQGPAGTPSTAPPTAETLPVTGSRAARNNNPLNLTTLPNRQWNGQNGADGRFAVFNSPEAGMAAADQNLQAYAQRHGINTLTGIINRWAPAGDGANNPRAYIQSVSQDIGVDPNQPLNLSDPKVRAVVLQSMAKVEGGSSGASNAAPASSVAQGGAVQDAAPAQIPGMHLISSAGQLWKQDGKGALINTVTGDRKKDPTFEGAAEKADPAIVKGLIEGRIAPPTQKAAATDYWQAQLNAAMSQDPTFDGVNFQARAKARADFTSGKSAQNITALNTVVGHLDTLDRAIDSLRNYGGFPGSKINNQLAHAIASGSGTDQRVQTFETAKQAVATELTRVFRGTGGAEADIQSWQKRLDAASSPESLHAVVRQMAELVNSRIEALGEQYTQGMGTTKEPITLLTPDKQRSFRRMMGDQAQAAPQASGGSGGTRPPLAAIFKR